jgi:hypothetical protein
MRFEWDGQKNRRNRAKHRVSFESAVLVFDDPHALSTLERIQDGEERWQTIGMAGGIVILLVAHTYEETGGEQVVHIISARKATPHERRVYEENY